MKQKIISFIGIILVFSGCAQKSSNISVFNKMQDFEVSLKNSPGEYNITNFDENIEVKHKNQQSISVKKETPPPVFTPKERVIKFSTSENNTIFNNNSKIAISVENIPISDFIKLAFGQILKLNYSIPQDIEKYNKTITLKMQQKVSKAKFFLIIKNLLNNNGIIFEKKDGIYYFKKGKLKPIQKLSNIIIYGRNVPRNLSNELIITMMIPTYYKDFTSLEWMLKRFYLSKISYVLNYRKDNILFITDYVKNLKNALKFIKLMDNPTLKNKYTDLIELKYIDSANFINRLKELLPASGVKIARNLNDIGVLIKNIPELNTILVVSDKREWIKLIKYWKEKLDILNLQSSEPQIFIYKPKNRDSKELVGLIKHIFSLTNKEVKNKKLARFDVIEDKERNELIIYATPKMYQKIYEMLKKLDILPKQVLIQVTIAEITLKDSLQYGFEWFLEHKGKTSYSLKTLGNLGIGSGGLVGNIINNDKTFQSILNFLAQKNLINILSSPKLIVLNNHTASINVGTQVPVLTSSTKAQNTSTNSITVTQSVQYRNTGIILNIKPIIHSNGILTLHISQTVSDPQPNNTSSISSPIILNRSLNTDVLLKTNESLLLGGLIKQNIGKTINKVPLLGDIPVLGNLFKTTSYSKEKTELIMIVKPVIITNTNMGAQITRNFQKLLKNNE